MRIRYMILAVCILVGAAGSVVAQENNTSNSSEASRSYSTSLTEKSEIAIAPKEMETTEWKPIIKQSMTFLVVQHSFRLTQSKTRRELDLPWFDQSYRRSIQGIGGWGDGDSFFTNDVAHPMMGAVSGFIFVQNDARARRLEFENSRAYWNSRLKAFGWAAVYSTQFEIGPLSEASVGHVGKRPGTNGITDFIVTPAGGLGLIVFEDWVDKTLVQKWERQTASLTRKRFVRVALNPNRALANVFRWKVPWFRDGRPLDDQASLYSSRADLEAPRPIPKRD